MYFSVRERDKSVQQIRSREQNRQLHDFSRFIECIGSCGEQAVGVGRREGIPCTCNGVEGRPDEIVVPGRALHKSGEGRLAVLQIPHAAAGQPNQAVDKALTAQQFGKLRDPARVIEGVDSGRQQSVCILCRKTVLGVRNSKPVGCDEVVIAGVTLNETGK